MTDFKPLTPDEIKELSTKDKFDYLSVVLVGCKDTIERLAAENDELKEEVLSIKDTNKKLSREIEIINLETRHLR